ncbi:MAG: hypothetical protein WCL28_13810, partial [bacterium]
MRMLAILASVVALSACGAIDQLGTASKPSVSAEEASAFSSQLPAVAIVRVPVDAAGQEMHDKAEMRTTNQNSISDASVASVFETAAAAVATVDELDNGSSTEAFGWRRCCRKAARKECRQQACAQRKCEPNPCAQRKCEPNQCAPSSNYSYSYSESESYSSSGGYAPGYNWNMYTPTYYYGGYYYNWDYAQTYKAPGSYNYYRYDSNFSQNYN